MVFLLILPANNQVELNVAFPLDALCLAALEQILPNTGLAVKSLSFEELP